MGFRYEPRYAVITFEPPFDGLEIRASLDLPATRQMRVIRQLAALKELTNSGDEEKAEQALRESAELFVTVTDGWNYEDAGGQPLPLDAETLLNVIPGNLFFNLTSQWAATVRGAGVDAPLGDESPSGEDSPANPTLKLATLSTSLAS